MSSIHTYKCLSPYVAFHHFFQSVVLLEVFFSSRMLPFPLLFFYLQENKTNNLRTCLLVVPSMTIAFFLSHLLNPYSSDVFYSHLCICYFFQLCQYKYCNFDAILLLILARGLDVRCWQLFILWSKMLDHIHWSQALSTWVPIQPSSFRSMVMHSFFYLLF